MAPSDQQKEETAEDRQRHADEENLHLRHQPRQDAKPEIEQQAEHQERRRKLHADTERAGDSRRDMGRHVAGERDSPGANSR